jgi:N,N-dimethylformamidase
MAQIRIHGYTDQLSVKAGHSVTAHISAEGVNQVQAQLVKLIHGDENPEGPGFIEQEIDSPINQAWPVTRQYIQAGNFLRVDDPQGRLNPTGAMTLHAFVYATVPQVGRQVILGNWDIDRQSGFALGINRQGLLEFWLGDGAQVDAVVAEVPLMAKIWYFVAATYDPASGLATVHQEAVLNRYNSLLSKIVPLDYRSHVQTRMRVKPAAGTAFLIAGAHDRNPSRGDFVAQCFNGKIDRPGIMNGVANEAVMAHLRSGQASHHDLTLAYWDTSAGYTDQGIGDTVYDQGPYLLHAQGVNCPVRGQTGWNWNGRNDCYRLAFHEYGGVEFHDDAMTDCQWAPTLTLDVPVDLKSGVYAIRLRPTAEDQHPEAGGMAEEYLPIFVRAAQPKAALAMLMPTASYMAYANAQLTFEIPVAQSITACVPIFQATDIDYYKNGLQFGLSTYDAHRSGHGVCYTSRRRPIINMRPKCRMPGVAWPWQFPADLSVIAWLEKMGYDYEIVTDEDLHHEGADALKPYKAVINGTHAEYYSEPMLDATEDYLAEGGRILYLSGNGYYWVVGFKADMPWVMEVRKLEAGSRAWQARPGEHYLATTGERSGLWRHRNRAPQKLVGTGFSSEGMDESVPFRRMPDSYHKSVSWIFEGVTEEVFGDFGLAGNGAAGVEIDRYDLTLGTPPHARILATSEGFSDNYPLVQEEIMYNHPGMGGTQNPGVRSDIVYFTTPNNGAVFSPSSIAWGQALPCRDFDNPVSTIMKNVVDAFIQEGELPGMAFCAEEKQWR